MADAGPVVRVKVTPTYEDFARQYAGTWWRQGGCVLPLLGVAFALVGIAEVAVHWRNPNPVLAGMMVFFGAGTYALGVLHRRLSARRLWGRSPEYRVRQVYEFSDDGIAYASEVGSGRFDWAVVRGARVVSRDLVLHAGSGPVVCLPE